MGEYADMAIDAMLAWDERQIEDEYNDYGDDPNWNPFTGRWSRFTTRSITCKRCGKTDLTWKRNRLGDWVLEEPLYWHNGFGDQIEWITHKCQLNIKAAFGAMKNPHKEYFQYLDSVPSITEEEYNEYG